MLHSPQPSPPTVYTVSGPTSSPLLSAIVKVWLRLPLPHDSSDLNCSSNAPKPSLSFRPQRHGLLSRAPSHRASSSHRALSVFL